MYFFKLKGEQVIDFRGDLILSHNKKLLTARVGSAGPKHAKNVRYIEDIPNLKFIRKIRATCRVIGFIWGKSQALSPKTIEAENGLEPAIGRKP